MLKLIEFWLIYDARRYQNIDFGVYIENRAICIHKVLYRPNLAWNYGPLKFVTKLCLLYN